MSGTILQGTTRVRYSKRTDVVENARDYDVKVQRKPRGPWVREGIVSAFGSTSVQWAALGSNAAAWTPYRQTRTEAVIDMLAGRTWQDPI